MSNEKIMILKMLEENKISAEEAAKLLEAINTKANSDINNKTDEAIPPRRIYGNVKKQLDEEEKTDTSKKSTSSFSKEYNDYTKSTAKDTNFYTHEQSKGSETKNSSQESFEDKFDNFTDEVSKRFESFSKTFEPRLREVSENIVDKTSIFAEKLSKSFQAEQGKKEGFKNKNTGNNSKSSLGSMEKGINIEIEGDDNQLNISSLKGSILLHGYNGNNISGKIIYKSKTKDANIDFIQLGTKYLLNYKNEDFENISIDLFIPEGLFSNIIIEGDGSSTTVSNITSDNFVLSNRNGETNVSDISANTIKIDCSNSKLSLNDLNGNIGSVENYNGNTILKNVNVKILTVDAFNSNVDLMMESFSHFNEYMWEIESNNGKIDFNLPIKRTLGYYINARTSLAHVDVSLLGLEYITNEETFVEARTSGYDNMENTVLLRLETSNAPISIS